MSAFRGPQAKGAMRQRRAQKRAQAEWRQGRAVRAAHPDGICDCQSPVSRKRKHRSPAATPEERLLTAIFGEAAS